MKRKYVVAGPFPAYGTNTGSIVELESTDPSVAANFAAGVLELDEAEKQKPPTIVCPACVGQDVKRPAKLASPEELAAHYDDAHPGLVAPEWKEEVS